MTHQATGAGQKIICLGFHKTGTSSLAEALRLLGYKTIHGDPQEAPHGGRKSVDLLQDYILKGNYDLPTFEFYDAFSDNPYFTIWREMYERFPDAKYILTLREDQAWIGSCQRYYEGRRIRPMRTWMFGEHADPSASPESRDVWLERYRKHNQDITDFFKEKQEQFLVMDISKGDGWNVLCPYLGKEIPDCDFPHKKKSRKSVFTRLSKKVKQLLGK